MPRNSLHPAPCTTLLVAGCGYAARRFLAMYHERFAHIRALSRDPDALRGQIPARVERLDWAQAAAGGLCGITHVLASVPPQKACAHASGDIVLAHFADMFRQHAKDLAWVGYLSSSVVYGDRGGGWVDEESPLAPGTDRGRRRLRAERAWRALFTASAVPVHVFRVAGIYGAGRNALERLRTGRARAVDAPGQIFSRIHVDDLARVLLASALAPEAGAVLNVADDCPASASDVLAHAARLMNVATPSPVPLAQAALSPMARSFYGERKRSANHRMKALLRNVLGEGLSYPDHRVGLDALWREMNSSACAGSPRLADGAAPFNSLRP